MRGGQTRVSSVVGALRVVGDIPADHGLPLRLALDLAVETRHPVLRVHRLILGVGVFKAHRLLYHSTLGWRVIKKKKGVGVSGLEFGV